MKTQKISTRVMAGSAMLSAVAVVLQYLEFPVPFLMPPFIKFDFSDLPALIGAFAYGPLSGVIIELIKNLIHCLATKSATVGELSNFMLGAVFTFSAGMIYKHNKTKGLSEAAQKQYKIYVDLFLRWFGGDHYLDEITEQKLEDFIIYKTSLGNKMISIATTMRHLRTYIKFCASRGYMEEVKVLIPKYEKELKIPYTTEEMDMLLVRPSSNSWVELRSWAMVNYFFSTGQRLSTVLNIKVSDLDLDNATVRLDWN